MACGALLAMPAASFLCGMTVTTTGVLVPAGLPIGLCLPLLLLLLATVCGFSWLRAGKLKAVSPLVAIRSGMEKGEWKKSPLPLRKRGLAFWMAARQVLVGKGRYAGTCLVAALLVFFAGLMGRVDSWLGPNGEGLMDAFNPADLHIAAQPMGETSLSAMGLLMAFLYTMVAVFVLVATLLTVEKLLRSERRDLAIYRALGFPARRLQSVFRLAILPGRVCRQPFGNGSQCRSHRSTGGTAPAGGGHQQLYFSARMDRRGFAGGRGHWAVQPVCSPSGRKTEKNPPFNHSLPVIFMEIKR